MNSQHRVSLHVFYKPIVNLDFAARSADKIIATVGQGSRATYLALNRVVPILNIFAASDSVSRATSASDFLFIGCMEEAGDWRASVAFLRARKIWNDFFAFLFERRGTRGGASAAVVRVP